MLLKECILLTVILTLTKYCASAETNSLQDMGNFRIICYYASWAAARIGVGKFTPENINPYLCTHLMYAFGSITKDGTFKALDENIDIIQGGYAAFTGLKAYNKELKTFLALGGWKEGDVRFSSIAANSTKRSVFIKNSIDFLRKHNFDGLNFDWQFPFRRDRNNYAALIKELREGYERESIDTGRPRLTLTITLPTSKDHITNGYDVSEITKYVDWMNVLTYDYHTTLEPVVNHHSQLYGLDQRGLEDSSDYVFNANYTINNYIDSGAERDKLVLGIPTYGRAYTLEDSSLTDIGSPAIDSGLVGPQTNETGFLAYYEICSKIKDDGWIVKQPYPHAMGSYAYKGNQWVCYDDEDIVRKKSQYVVDNKLGGIYFWLIEYDDFRGICTGKKYPLIEAAKEALIIASRYGLETNSFYEVNKTSRNQKSLNEDSVPTLSLPVQYTTPEPPPTPSYQVMSSTGKSIDPVLTVSSSPEVPSGKTIVSNPPLVNEDKYDNSLKDTVNDIKKLAEDVKILSKQFQNFIGRPGGDIEKLKKFLDTQEITTSKSESPQQEILNAQLTVNQQIKSPSVHIAIKINL